MLKAHDGTPLEQKTMRFKLEKMDDDAGTFEGMASTFQPEDGPGDSYGDVVRPGAYQETIQYIKDSGKPLKALWNHDWDKIVGGYNGTDLKEVGSVGTGGLWVKGFFSKFGECAATIRGQMSEGLIDGLSIGYAAVGMEWPKETSAAWRILTKIHLYEISPVTFPADMHTYIAGVKSAEISGLLGWLQNAVAEQKAGKVFSASNYQKIKEASNLLSELLAKAEDEKPPEADPKTSPLVLPAPNKTNQLILDMKLAVTMANLRMAAR